MSQSWNSCCVENFRRALVDRGFHYLECFPLAHMTLTCQRICTEGQRADAFLSTLRLETWSVHSHLDFAQCDLKKLILSASSEMVLLLRFFIYWFTSYM